MSTTTTRAGGLPAQARRQDGLEVEGLGSGLADTALQFKAKAKPRDVRQDERVGTGTLTVSVYGLYFLKKTLWGSPEPIQVEWVDLRDLSDRLLDKGYFRANVGEGTEDVIVKFVIKSGDIAALSAIFDALPDEVRHPKCPACAGPVLDGTCVECGRSRATEHRKAGLESIMAGAFALGAAAAVSYASGYGWIAIGLIAFGSLSLFRGLWKTITGW